MSWRLPSMLLGMVVGALPIGTGKTISMWDEELSNGAKRVHLKAGNTKAKFITLSMEHYPQWGAFDPDHMYPAKDLGGRIAMVEWACSKTMPELAGVYLDGESAVATDRFRLARVPLAIPDLPKPVVLPSGILSTILRETGEIQIGADPSSNLLNIMPDTYTQVKSIVMDVNYPNVSAIMAREFNTSVTIDRDHIIELMKRVNTFAIGDRISSMHFYFGEGMIAIYLINEEIGDIGDIYEVPNQIGHERILLRFTPKNIMEAIEKAPNKQITLSYDVDNPRSILKVDGGSGYEAWVMPRTTGES